MANIIPFIKSKKPQSIDEFMEELRSQHSKDLDSSFKEIDKFQEEENIHHYLNNILHPAMDEFYKGFTGYIETQKLDDTAKIKSKDKKNIKHLKSAAISGLKKFFSKTSPSFLKAVEDIKDEEELYDTLVRQYDRITGQNIEKGEGLAALIEGLSKNSKSTFGEAKMQLYQSKTKHASSAFGYLSNVHSGHHLSKYLDHEVAAYMEKWLSKTPFKVQDKYNFLNLGKREYNMIRRGVKKGSFPEGLDVEQLGLSSPAFEKKEEKKEYRNAA